MTPTPEQAAIVLAARETKDNLLISALAGAAKTSTLVLIAEALPSVDILCLAFNKKIALEMQERLPSNCEAKTLNSIGFKAWMGFIRKRANVDPGKNYRLLKEEIDKLDPSEKQEVRESFSTILDVVRQGKSGGWVPDMHKFQVCKPLLSDDEFFLAVEENLTELEEALVRAVTLRSLKEAWEGTIDFDDQVLCPVVFPATFSHPSLTMVDEAQDLSELNHVMLSKITKGNRLIAVGDECQAIYGFRGASESSMMELQQKFSMRPLGLSVSFRCPVAVVHEAHWRAPHMKWPEWAKPGEVRHLVEWDSSTIEEGAAILCRNNAPLFSMAIKLLKNGRAPELSNNDIGKYLIKVLRGFGDLRQRRPQVLTALATWKEERLKKNKNSSRTEDQVECLRVFINAGQTLGDAISYAEHIFATTGPIKLMTGHKSKGLEFDNVYILDEHLIGAKGQDPNLRYVMQTRAKGRLSYIRSDNFEDQYEEKENADVQ